MSYAVQSVLFAVYSRMQCTVALCKAGIISEQAHVRRYGFIRVTHLRCNNNGNAAALKYTKKSVYFYGTRVSKICVFVHF
jgi:hypothetical protein